MRFRTGMTPPATFRRSASASAPINLRGAPRRLGLSITTRLRTMLSARTLPDAAASVLMFPPLLSLCVFRPCIGIRELLGAMWRLSTFATTFFKHNSLLGVFLPFFFLFLQYAECGTSRHSEPLSGPSLYLSSFRCSTFVFVSVCF